MVDSPFVASNLPNGSPTNIRRGLARRSRTPHCAGVDPRNVEAFAHSLSCTSMPPISARPFTSIARCSALARRESRSKPGQSAIPARCASLGRKTSFTLGTEAFLVGRGDPVGDHSHILVVAPMVSERPGAGCLSSVCLGANESLECPARLSRADGSLVSLCGSVRLRAALPGDRAGRIRRTSCAYSLDTPFDRHAQDRPAWIVGQYNSTVPGGILQGRHLCAGQERPTDKSGVPPRPIRVISINCQAITMFTGASRSGPFFWPIRQLVPVAGRLQRPLNLLSASLPAAWSVGTIQPARHRPLGFLPTHALCEIAGPIATGSRECYGVSELWAQNDSWTKPLRGTGG